MRTMFNLAFIRGKDADGLVIEQLHELVAPDLRVAPEVAMLDQPRPYFAILPTTVNRILRAGVVVLNELERLVLPDLRVRLDDVVFDEPRLEIRFGPCRPDRVVDVVVVSLHLLRKSVALLLVVGLDDPVLDEPFVLRAGASTTRVNGMQRSHVPCSYQPRLPRRVQSRRHMCHACTPRVGPGSPAALS
jgi:hypothetical protein